jgi:hypothetical protein
MHQRTPYLDRRGGAAMLLRAIIKSLKFVMSSHSSTTKIDTRLAAKSTGSFLTGLLKRI